MESQVFISVAQSTGIKTIFSNICLFHKSACYILDRLVSNFLWIVSVKPAHCLSSLFLYL